MSEIIKGFLSCSVLTMSVYFFGKILFIKSKTKNQVIELIIFVSSCILHTAFYFLFSGTLKTILICSSFAIIFKYVFKLNYGKSIFVTIIYSILTIIPDLIVTVSFIYILGVGKDTFYNSMSGSVICNLAVGIIILIITYILKKPLKKIIDINISTNKRLFFISITTMIALAIFFYNLIKTFQFNNNIASFLIVISALISVLFYTFKQRIENDSILKSYDELLDIMKNYEDDIEEQRTLIHETKNELTTIRCKIKDKEKESEIIDYIDSIMGDKVSSKMSKYSKFKYLPSNGLKGFFYYKVSEAERKGIKVSTNISKKIENSILGKLDTKHFKDLARVIGVYLDNAIEASSLSEEKKLGIELYLIKNNVEIIISNTYHEAIDEEKIGKERYSTKGKNRGHGLLLVKRILKDNNNIISNNEVTGELYIQKISIIDNTK